MKRLLSILKNKSGETTGLSMSVKILISCILGAMLFTFSYWVVENYYVKSVVDNQDIVYASSVSPFNNNATYSVEVEHSTAINE